MIRLGLIGDPIAHSKSPEIFTRLFEEASCAGSYRLFPLRTVTRALLDQLFLEEELTGLNVTVPHKRSVMELLDRIDPKAARIGAVNTIVREGSELVGYNTDFEGIQASLTSLLSDTEPWPAALVLGDGGASKAVQAFLEFKGVDALVVSRTSRPWTFEQLPAEVAASRPLWVQCTPVGGPSFLNEYLTLPYHVLTPEFAIFDLIYTPEPTALMELAAARGARTIGGRLMLETQAKYAWTLFQDAYYKTRR